MTFSGAIEDREPFCCDFWKDRKGMLKKRAHQTPQVSQVMIHGKMKQNVWVDPESTRITFFSTACCAAEKIAAGASVLQGCQGHKCPFFIFVYFFFFFFFFFYAFLLHGPSNCHHYWDSIEGFILAEQHALMWWHWWLRCTNHVADPVIMTLHMRAFIWCCTCTPLSIKWDLVYGNERSAWNYFCY